MAKVAKKRKTFIDVLFEKRRGMTRLENAGAASLRRQMRRIKRDSLKLIERNMGTFRRTGEYIDSPSALMTAKRTATEMDILLQQRLAGPTNDVIRLRQTAWDQGVIDLKGASRRLPQDIQASMNASFGQVNLQAAVAARTNPLFGIAPRAAFNGIRGHTTKRVQELLSSAVLSSASVKETAQQLADAMDLNVAAAQRIVRTNMNAAYNEAHRAIYNANPEIFSGYRWEAVFDDRTSVICLELHGSFYPLGTVPPGPPAHWNCRSILVGVFRDQDIEKVVEDTPRRVREFKELPDGTFKSITKTVAGDLRASDWLKSQPFGIVQDVTGSRLKAEFFLQGTASLDDIVTPGLRIRNNRAFMKRMAALHPNNKRYQKMAHELGVKRVPKIDSVRRGDAVTASRQPFDQPVPDLDKIQEAGPSFGPAAGPEITKLESAWQETVDELAVTRQKLTAARRINNTEQIALLKKDETRLINKRWRRWKRLPPDSQTRLKTGVKPKPTKVLAKATPRQKFDTGVTNVEETNRRIVELRTKVSPSLEEAQELKALQAVRTKQMNKLRALRRADPTLPELPESTRLPKGVGVKPRPTVGAPERRRIQFSPEVQKLKTQVDELDVEWNKLTQKLRPLDRENAFLHNQRRRLRQAGQRDTAAYRGLNNKIIKVNWELDELRGQVDEVRDRLLTAHQKFNKAATVERAEVLAKIRTPKFVSKADNAIARAKAELDSLGYDLATLRHQSSNPTELLDLLNSVHGQGAGVKLTPTRQAIWDNIKKEMQSLKQWNTTKGQQWKQLLGAMDESLLQDFKLKSIYFQFSRERRAFANRFVNNIGIKKGEQMRTLTHEFGHHLQYRNPELRRRTLQWQRARTKDDALTTIYKGTKERGKKDKFYGHYVGKVYRDGFQEGVSMGLQTFMDRRGSWRQIVKTDPDHMYLMWAMLRGY